MGHEFTRESDLSSFFFLRITDTNRSCLASLFQIDISSMNTTRKDPRHDNGGAICSFTSTKVDSNRPCLLFDSVGSGRFKSCHKVLMVKDEESERARSTSKSRVCRPIWSCWDIERRGEHCRTQPRLAVPSVCCSLCHTSMMCMEARNIRSDQ